jgi:hypothetical protein
MRRRRQLPEQYRRGFNCERGSRIKETELLYGKRRPASSQFCPNAIAQRFAVDSFARELGLRGFHNDAHLF